MVGQASDASLAQFMFWPAGPAILGQTWRANHMFEVGTWPVGPATLGPTGRASDGTVSGPCFCLALRPERPPRPCLNLENARLYEGSPNKDIPVSSPKFLRHVRSAILFFFVVVIIDPSEVFISLETFKFAGSLSIEPPAKCLGKILLMLLSKLKTIVVTTILK
jgi:hypothetical protein